MKKVKNIVLTENDSSLKHIKEGKVKKKHKKEKKFKDAFNDISDLNLVPRDSTNLNTKNKTANKIKKSKKPKSESAKQGDNQDHVEKQSEVNAKKIKKQKLKFIKKDDLTTTSPPKKLTQNEKIEKKKMKKLAQRLKKSESKNKNLLPADAIEKTESFSKTVIKNVGTTRNKVVAKSLGTSATRNVDATISKVLSKKENKALKRQQIKEQKLAENQDQDPAEAAATVFVGNVNVNTKRIDLVRIFKDFGPVKSIRLRTAGGKVLYRHKQRKSASSLNAYVVLTSKEAAEKAISLNGIELKGNHLRVTLATKDDHTNKRDEGKKTVLIGNLKYSATEESLREIFSSCGEINYVRCIQDGDKGCKGIAFVCFKTADSMVLALELNGTIVDGRPINVERFNEKKLGAKQAREAQVNEKDKPKKGAKQRLDNKKGKKEKICNKQHNQGEVNDAKKQKKSEFRGVKIDGIKKKLKSKKKKSKDQMLQLAKKIAPKTI